MEHALTKSLIRNEAIKSLCSSVRRFQDATVKPECKSDLSVRSSGIVESSRSGGGSDSELSHVRTIQTDDFRRRAGSAVSHPNTARTGSADQLEHRSNSGDPCDPVQPRIQATHLGHFAVGTDSELGQRSKDRVQDHQCEGRDGRYGTVVSPSVQETALFDSGRWILRMEESSRRQNPLYDLHERQFTLRIRWSLGGLERSANGEWLHTCTIITGEPNEFVRQIHTRMPVILPEELHEAWLSGEAGKEVLVPYPADRMKAWPISARVNSPKNNDLTP